MLNSYTELKNNYVSSLWAFQVLLYLNLHLLNFGKCFVTRAHYCSKMGENIISVLSFYKPKSLFVIKPLHPACCGNH